jgi:putative flippase GtrA
MNRPLCSLFLKFGAVGSLGFVVDAAFLYLGIYVFSLSPVHAALFSYPFAVTFSWAGNRYFTFKETPRQPMMRQWAVFAATCTLGLIFNRGTYTLLVSTVPLVYNHPGIGLVAGTAAGMLVNFFLARNLVFIRATPHN